MPAALVAVHSGHVRLWSALALAIVALMAFAQTTRAAPRPADPVTGNTKWAILLCSFADHPNNPPDMQPPASFFEDLFTEKGVGKGGMFDYW